MDFNQLFTPISPEEMNDNVFTLVGKELFALTAGKKEHYNSMIGSGGGLGLLFRKPVTWCVVRTDRYTLELIRKEHRYTLAYFPETHREQMLFLGSKSGKDSEKMKEVKLAPILTPSGNISFREARLIMECTLTQLTTPSPDDFYTQEARDYLKEIYTAANHYRQYLFGEITDIWIKK
ncbi:MAG: hypothetical protein LIP05_06655 [Tannerellaceae bacterium]|nr:hypothetical protein [Tannerellaceae bacterium]